MGVPKLCTLINSFYEPNIPTQPHFFDSILYDVQSLLHVAISQALVAEEKKLFKELCRLAWKSLEFDLNQFLSFATADTITLILSFDGDGVPMKWPTQRARRMRKEGEYIGKEKYRAALFGNNIMALRVQDYFKERLKRYRFRNIRELRVILSGCNVPGEGEHKLFHIAEALHCQHPIVASQDQDVFILALMRRDFYNTLQIYRYGKYYPFTQLVQEWLPAKSFETCSFLFGNDFVPTIVGITDLNAPAIAQALQTVQEDEPPPNVMAHFIQILQPHLRYTEVTHMDSDLMIAFWVTFLWLKDYYTRPEFPQKYMINSLFDEFDRNLLLTGLTLPEFSKTCYERAQVMYRDAVTQPAHTDQAVRNVFMHDGGNLKTYWITPTDKACVSLRLTKSSPDTRPLSGP